MTTLDEPAASRPAPPPGDAPDRARRGPVRTVLATLLVLTGLGVLAGVVWWLLWDPPAFTVSGGQGAMGEVDLERRFDADGWFVVVSGAVGLLAGALLTWRGRPHRLASLAALVVGSALGVLAMRVTGGLLGPGDADAAIAAAADGARVPVELAVSAPGAYAAWPVMALFGAATVLWAGTDARLPARDDDPHARLRLHDRPHPDVPPPTRGAP